VRASEFEPNKRFRRVLNRNSDLSASIVPAIATQEQFDLLKEYLLTRHVTGGMADMDFMRYEMMVEECSAETEIVEYRMPNGTLIAAILIDRLSDGLSLVYSFFSPEEQKRSLGNLMILDQIKRCAHQSMPYLYLGYWVPDSPKMDYKARFRPCETLTHRGWALLGETT